MGLRLPPVLAIWGMAARAALAADTAPGLTAPVSTAATDTTSAQIGAWLSADVARLQRCSDTASGATP